MGLRFRKSYNLGCGFRINISKHGVGYSWGVPGYRISKSASGQTRKTYSIPGTGISYVEQRKNKNASIKPIPIQILTLLKIWMFRISPSFSPQNLQT